MNWPPTQFSVAFHKALACSFEVSSYGKICHVIDYEEPYLLSWDMEVCSLLFTMLMLAFVVWMNIALYDEWNICLYYLESILSPIKAGCHHLCLTMVVICPQKFYHEYTNIDGYIRNRFSKPLYYLDYLVSLANLEYWVISNFQNLCCEIYGMVFTLRMHLMKWRWFKFNICVICPA